MDGTDTPSAGPAPASACAAVRVTAPARLHLGFLDLNGGLGRRFGSVGVALQGPATVIEARRAGACGAEGPGAARAAAFARRMCEHLGVPPQVAIRVREAIPEHAGLGSGTQLALAVGTAVARLHGRELTAVEVAEVLERGQRSGVGIGVFEGGGLVVDAGRAAPGAPPVVVARAAVPDRWRAILVTDGSVHGLNGPRERAAFTHLPPMPPQQAAAICRRVLMQVLPGVVEGDVAAFGAGITAIQEAVGAYFAPEQGGAPFTSAAVQRAVAWLASRGAPAVGQTSWGPTGFAIVGDEELAARLLREAHRRFADEPRLGFLVCPFRNAGAAVEVVSAQAPRQSAGASRGAGG